MDKRLKKLVLVSIYLEYPFKYFKYKEVNAIFNKTESFDRTVVILRIASELSIGLEAAFKLNEIALHGDKTQLNRYGRDIEYFTNLII